MAALFCLLLAQTWQMPLLHAQQNNVKEPLVIETKSGPRSFNVEIAKTDAQKARGLMFRSSLPSGEGMLFPYNGSRPASMWMRNTYISLDMIFISADGRVHTIVERAPPHSETIISSNGPVAGVLEIAGGEAARLQIQTGDLVRHSHFGTPLPAH